MEERIYDVPGISCDHCRRAIEEELATLPGVDTVSVDVATHRVRVAGVVAEWAVVRAIGEAGYDVAEVHPVA